MNMCAPKSTICHEFNRMKTRMSINWMGKKCVLEPKTPKCKQRCIVCMTWHEYIVRSTRSHAHAANLVNFNSTPRQTTQHTSPQPYLTQSRNFRANFHFLNFFVILHLFMTCNLVNKALSAVLCACNGTSNWIQDKNRWYLC